MDTEEGVEVVWNEVVYSETKRTHKDSKVSVFDGRNTKTSFSSNLFLAGKIKEHFTRFDRNEGI